MAGSSYNKEAYWPDVLTLSEEQVKDCFREFKVISFTEHKTSGVASDGEQHNWHIFSVVAKKESNNGN